MKTKIKKQNNLINGFSLVEMLVAIAIFMSIVTIAVGSLISIIGANKKAQVMKNTVDGVNFAIENISRDMRMGTDYMCLLSDDTYSKDCTLSDGTIPGSSAVQYNNGSDEVTYKFNGNSGPAGILTKTDSNGTVDLISLDSGVNITNMKFYVIGSKDELVADPTSRTQPRVIITASGLISVQGSNATSSFNLQTEISQRARN